MGASEVLLANLLMSLNEKADKLISLLEVGKDAENELLFPIPQDILTSTIEAMRDYQLRLEVEATALAGLNDPAAQELAQERLEQARRVKTLFQHYSQL